MEEVKLSDLFKKYENELKEAIRKNKEKEASDLKRKLEKIVEKESNGNFKGLFVVAERGKEKLQGIIKKNQESIILETSALLDDIQHSCKIGYKYRLAIIAGVTYKQSILQGCRLTQEEISEIFKVSRHKVKKITALMEDKIPNKINS